MCVLKVKVISLPYIFQVLYVLCFSRPRYQVSIHRTIGSLVFIPQAAPIDDKISQNEKQYDLALKLIS